MSIFRKGLLFISSIFICILGFFVYFNFFKDKVLVSNGVLSVSTHPVEQVTSKYKPKLNFQSAPVSKVSDIAVTFFGKPAAKDFDIYLKAERYYLPLTEVAKALDLNYVKADSTVKLSGNTSVFYINIKDNSAWLNGKEIDLRGKYLIMNDDIYISISDIERLFNLRTFWDFKAKSINFIDGVELVHKEPVASGKAAFMRLEDVSAGSTLLNAVNMEKFKLLADLLYENNIRYHIAWVPRYKNPSAKIDNNLVENSSIENAAFIDMLDYCINRGAMIGLHGYTHQYKNEISLSGIELSGTANNSEKETRAVVESGIDTAAFLNIPVNFFESPHYGATRAQKKIIEEYFQLLYEPYNLPMYYGIRVNSRGNLYIPTPLDYVKNSDPQPIVDALKKTNSRRLASFFFHPGIEFKYINVEYTDNALKFTYSEQSPMHKIVEALNKYDYVTSYVTEFTAAK